MDWTTLFIGMVIGYFGSIFTFFGLTLAYVWYVYINSWRGELNVD